MTAVLFAAFSAAAYGAADFSGAVASKEQDSTLVTVAMHTVSLIALAAIVGLVAGGEWTVADLAWGALGGVGAAYGQTTFFKALALGPMSTAAALTAISSATIPIVAGLLLGDRPGLITMAGIGLALPGAVMVSIGGTSLRTHGARSTPRERVIGRRQTNRTRMLALSAGVGFGLFFIALSRTSGDAGLIPLLSARVASILSLSTVLTAQRLWTPIARRWWPVVLLTGLFDCAANSFYLLALRDGSFTWVAAISSLYPVSTVLLARILLSERLSRGQIVGTLMAGVALALVAVGAET